MLNYTDSKKKDRMLLFAAEVLKILDFYLLTLIITN